MLDKTPYQNLLEQIKQQPLSIKDLDLQSLKLSPKEQYELYLTATKKNVAASQYVPEEMWDDEMALTAISMTSEVLGIIPIKKLNEKIILAALQQSDFSFNQIPASFDLTKLSFKTLASIVEMRYSGLEFLMNALPFHALTNESWHKLYALAVNKYPPVLMLVPLPERQKLFQEVIASNCVLLKYFSEFNDIDTNDPNIQKAIAQLKIELVNNWSMVIHDFKNISKKLIDNELREIFSWGYALSVNREPQDIISVPEEFITHEMCLSVAKKSGELLRLIPKSFRTYEVCAAAITNDPTAIEHIEHEKERPLLTSNQYEDLLQLSITVQNSTINRDIIFKSTIPELNNLLDTRKPKDPQLIFIFNFIKNHTKEDLAKFEKMDDLFGGIFAKRDSKYDINSFNNPENWNKFFENFSKLNIEEKEQFFTFLSYKYSLDQKLINLKQFFSNNDPEKQAVDKIEQAFLSQDPNALFMIALLTAFSEGNADLDHFTQGQFKNIHGLLVCAEVASRKPYQCTPTIVADEDLPDYFQVLKSSNLNLRERLCSTGFHWYVADIEIEEKNTNVLIVDARGDAGYTRKFRNRFVEKFPEASFYMDLTKKQYTAHGCSIFSLDDIIHLSTVENYLPEKNIFTHFNNQKSQLKSEVTNQSASNDVQIVALPLSLLRNMHHRSLINNIIPNRYDKNLPINKKGKTALETVSFSQKSFFKKDKSIMIETNERLNIKFRQTAGRVLNFITNKSPSEALLAMEKHTLNGFKNRIQKMTLSKTESNTPKLP